MNTIPIQISPFIEQYVDAFVKELDKVMDRHSVRVALDVGSRDAVVAILLKERFPEATVYAFECNPPAIEDCKVNIGNRPSVILVDKAVSDENGLVDFYAIDPKKTITTWPDGNIAASSLYIANPAYPHERYHQNKIVVEAVTLEQWAMDSKVNAVDVLWMDLQGAELKALKGMGELLETVKVIYTEVEYKEVYFDQPLFDEVNEFLVLQGFRLHAKMNTSVWFGDALYIREELG